jgi:bifunctional DNA-binding transcriptional regulator/antitoxin component of YhaV-PrlF toxin-antitoxin module
MLPVEFKVHFGQSGKITIPKEVRESIKIRENDVVQIVIRGVTAGKRHWTELKNQLTTCVRVQRKYVIRIPNLVRKCAGLKGGEDIVVRIEKIARPRSRKKSKSRTVYIRREYVERFGIHTGDIIQITIVGVDSKRLPESKQLTVTTRMQKTTAYLPRFVADFYRGTEKIRVRVDKVVRQLPPVKTGGL